MNNPKNKDEHAKNSDFKTPMDLPHVKPGDYDVSIDSSHGSARSPGKQVVTPDRQEDPARRRQKQHGEMPLHDEAIGGA